MSEIDDRPGWLRAVRATARVIVAIGVVVYTLLDEVLFPLFRPLIAWLGHLKLFERLGALIGSSPPYLALLLLAVPFAIIEPAKVYALFLFASGHILLGPALLVVAQVLSLLICERIYHAGYAPLMRIVWFRRLMAWLVTLRDKALGWIRSSAAWQWSRGVAVRIRAWFRGLLALVR